MCLYELTRIKLLCFLNIKPALFFYFSLHMISSSQSQLFSYVLVEHNASWDNVKTKVDMVPTVEDLEKTGTGRTH